MALPALIPLAIAIGTYGAEAAGHEWNVHGDVLGLFLLSIVLLLVGAVVEIFALARALPALLKSPEERTPGNVLCAGLGLAFLVFCVCVAFWLA